MQMKAETKEARTKAKNRADSRRLLRVDQTQNHENNNQPVPGVESRRGGNAHDAQRSAKRREPMRVKDDYVIHSWHVRRLVEWQVAKQIAFSVPFQVSVVGSGIVVIREDNFGIP